MAPDGFSVYILSFNLKKDFAEDLNSSKIITTFSQ